MTGWASSYCTERRLPRATASIELVLVATALFSMVLVGSTLWRIRSAHEQTRSGAQHQAFLHATDYDIWAAGGDFLREQLPAWFLQFVPLDRYAPGMLYSRATGGGHAKVEPRLSGVVSDLHLGRLPNLVIPGVSQREVGGPAGVFGKFGPYALRGEAATIGPPWTYHSWPWTMLQTRPEADAVQKWYQSAMDKSIGKVRDPLKLDVGTNPLAWLFYKFLHHPYMSRRFYSSPGDGRTPPGTVQWFPPARPGS